MKPIRISTARSKFKIALGHALAMALVVATTAHAADRKQTLGSVQIKGFGKLNLVGSIPEGAGAENVSKLQLQLGTVPLISFPTQDLEHCREGSPAVLNSKGEPLADLMGHPTVKGLLAAFPEVRESIHVHLSCGSKDEHGLPTLQLSMEEEGESMELGRARINPTRDEWEFVDVNGTVYESGTSVRLNPRDQGEFSVISPSAESGANQSKDSLGAPSPTSAPTPAPAESDRLAD